MQGIVAVQRLIPGWSIAVQIVEAIADANVLDASGQETYSLRAGCRYILYDAEAGNGLRDGALRLIGGLDRVLPFYNRQPLTRHRLILPFIGRQGDAVVAASCLETLKERYTDVTIDVAAPDPAQAVLRLLPRLGELRPYPLEAERIDDYDYYLSFEEIEAVPQGSQRSCADVFSTCLRTPKPNHPPSVTVPADAQARWAFPPTARLRVAVHVGRSDNLRSYPRDLLLELARRLVDQGCEVYLIGAADPTSLLQPDPSNLGLEAPRGLKPAARPVPVCSRGLKPAARPVPVCPRGLKPAARGDSDECLLSSATEHVKNLVGQTQSPGDLAAVLEQMQALVTGDSFPMHLAGAMGVATIALFTTTDAVIGSDYVSVEAVQSQASCSPCRIAEGVCPLGHRKCTAYHNPSVNPESVVERVRSLVQVAGTV
ncbi:MAG: glycosyltransferase family 9 protein [Phycisphaerae bacterium]